MKKLFFIMILAFVAIITSAWSAKQEQSRELLDMVTLANEINMDINGWSVTFKESLPKDEIYSIIEKIEQYGSLEKSTMQHGEKYFTKNAHKTAGLIESFIMIVPSNGDDAELIVELKGEHWDKNTYNQIQKRINGILKTLFTTNVKSFACLQASSNDMIDVGKFSTKLKRDFNIKSLTEQDENLKDDVNKKIYYGYIPKWSARMVIAEQEMNMQAVITNTNDGRSKLTIGTPILLNEY